MDNLPIANINNTTGATSVKKDSILALPLVLALGLKRVWDGRTYRKMKKDFEGAGMPKQFWLPSRHVPSLNSALYRDLDYNPLSISINPKDPVTSSHELGHFTDFKKNKGNVKLYKALDDLPLVHHFNTLLKERNANKESWNLIRQAYKDDPELIKRFGELRSKQLTKAYMTYLTLHGTPLVGAAGLGALGAYLGSRVSGNFNDKDLEDLPEEERKKLLKRRHRNGRIVGGIAGGAAGLVLGSNLGEKLAPALNMKAVKSIISQQNDKGYQQALKELAKSIRKFKPKK